MGTVKTKKTASFTLPAGRYYVGDPCYAFSLDTTTWMDLIEKTDCFGVANHLKKHYTMQKPVKHNGGLMWGAGTAYGDGCYRGSDGSEFGVDAGMLGIVSENIAEDNALYAMKLIEVDESNNEVTYDGHGNFNICGIEINTDGSDEISECYQCGNETDYEGELCDSCQEDEDE